MVEIRNVLSKSPIACYVRSLPKAYNKNISHLKLMTWNICYKIWNVCDFLPATNEQMIGEQCDTINTYDYNNNTNLVTNIQE